VPEDILPTSTIPRGGAELAAAAIPCSVIRLEQLQAGIPAFKLFHETGLAPSGAAARRLIGQGGAYVNGERIDVYDRLITAADLTPDQSMVLRSGKKAYHQVRVGK
jgi:tyrosyl-tRNA synthetase